MDYLAKNINECDTNYAFDRIGHARIVSLIPYCSNLVMSRPELFSQLVEEVKQMGIDTQKSIFVKAIHALSGQKCGSEIKRLIGGGLV